MAACFECTFVVEETRRLLSRTRRIRRAWLFGVAAAIALCMLPFVTRLIPADRAMPALRSAAFELTERPVEGRLDGFEHRPYVSLRSNTQAGKPTISMRAASEQIPERDLHARGVAALLAGDAATAVILLGEAANEEPRERAVWNDLAAAEIALAAIREDRTLLAAADDAATHSLSIRPSSAAYFNRGLALEHLGRRTEAAGAYARALAVETDDAWRDEMHDRLIATRKP